MFLTTCNVRLQPPDFSHLCHMRGQLVSCLSQPEFEEIYNISINSILSQLYLRILIISNSLQAPPKYLYILFCSPAR